MKMTLMLGSGAVAVALLLASGVNAATGILTDKKGMTLYTYDKDTGGMSSCYQDCAKNWPPYIAKTTSAVNKDWTMVKRKDGKMQWAYDGKPLYYYVGDKKKGDVAGDNKGGVWHVVQE